jgi:signal transduction histidine kinase/integral membrane sensor domain MASE1
VRFALRARNDEGGRARKRSERGASAPGPLRHVLETVALAIVYVAVARLGLMLGPIHRFATLVWAPTGISLAALLLGGYRFWPGIALGAFVANWGVGAPIPVAVAIGAGNTLEAIAGAYLVRRMGRFRRSLGDVRVVLALIALAAIASTAISTTVGVSSLLLGGQVSRGELVETWRTWWLGDAAGDLIVAPLILAWCDAPRRRPGSRWLAEGGLLALTLGVASVLTFARPPANEPTGFLQACMLVPLLIWAALRFGMRGATSAVFLTSVVAVSGTTLGRGPFIHETLSLSLLYLQSFMAIAAVAALLLGAVVAERMEALRRAEMARHRSERLASLGESLNANSRIEEVLETGAIQAAQLLGGDDGAICLVEGEGRRLQGAFEMSASGRIDALLDLDRLPHSRAAVERRKPVYFTGAEVAGAESEWFEKLGIDAALAAPLVSGGRFIGILYVHYWQDRFSRSDEDLDFAQAVAGLCALALTRSQVYEAERDSRVRAEAAERESRRIADLHEQLVAMVSHDLRNPLAAIIAGIRLLSDKRRNGEHWEQVVLERQARSAQRIEGLVRDVLDFAKARGAGAAIPVRPEPVRMGDLCGHVVRELEQANPGRRIVLRVDGDDRGEWDAARMAQVVSNLVGNAVQHSDESAPVEITIRGSSDNLVLAVHNPGPAIPEKLIPVLFEPFTRGVSGTPATPTANVGLGLFIVRQIVEAHGGTVDVCSRPGEGTRFAVKLPRLRHRQSG